MKVGKAKVLYLSPERITFRRVQGIIEDFKPDAIYCNSVFAKFSWMVLILLKLGICDDINIGIAPCGELSDGALEKGGIKKRVFLRIYSWIGLQRTVLWRASDSQEAMDIYRRIGRRPFGVIPDLVDSMPNQPSETKKEAGRLRMVFVSRIVPKKNLEFLLEILQAVNGEVSLDIFGPIEDSSYGSRLKTLAGRLGRDKEVRFRGPVPHNEVFDRIRESDLFVLPSLSENFGHVIVESLAVGVPVLLSDNTPWLGLTELGIGDDIPLSDRSRWVREIERWIGMGEDEHHGYQTRALAYASSYLAGSLAREASLKFFNRLLEVTDCNSEKLP